MAPTISPEVAESSLQSVQVLRLNIKATVQLCNAMDCVELKQDCEKWNYANPKILQKSGRETGRSWTTGIGRPRASVAPRPGSGEEGGPAAPLFSVSWF